MPPHDSTSVSRAALVTKIAANSQAWNELNDDIQNDIAAYGCGSVSDFRYQTLDGIYIRGLDLRADLSELDAAAAAAPRPVMVQQQCQLQQADASKAAGGPACEACGRPLSDPESIKAGIGPICRAHGHTRRQLHMWELLVGADYESEWDEIVVQDGRFAGFQSINVRDRSEALQIIAKRRIAATPMKVMSVTDFLAAGAAAFEEVARIETNTNGEVTSVTFPRA